jgi:hypothetical protein
MGNGAVKLNTIAICAVSFMSVAITAWVIYVALILTTGINDKIPPIPYVDKTKWGCLILGILFTIGTFLSSLLNRTGWAPGSVGNWTNTFFWAGLVLSLMGVSSFITVLFRDDSKNEPIPRAIAILTLIIGCWLLLIPDLMPEDCAPKS